MTLMTAAQIAEVPYERAIAASWPFLLSHLFVITIASAFPGFVRAVCDARPGDYL
jgi:TRAP-type C4-dicarboxylate transport system permease large subunit